MSLPEFPPPPLGYIGLYSDENINRGRAPPPPPLPSKGGEAFPIFGAPQWNDDYVVRPFESLKIRRLYGQSFDRKRELKKVLHSILAVFLDLIDVLVKCPRSTERNNKLENLNLLFIHFQHLVNEYRVHQARDGVRSMLEVQRRQTIDFTERLNLHVDKASEIVALCTGTTSSEQAQAHLASQLKWDIARLQARRVELINSNSTDNTQIGRMFDRFMCDLTSQEDEEENNEHSNDWMKTDEVMEEGNTDFEVTDDLLASVTGVDREKSALR